MKAHGLHHSLGCFLDGDLIFLTHCGEQWVSGQSSLLLSLPQVFQDRHCPTHCEGAHLRE